MRAHSNEKRSETDLTRKRYDRVASFYDLFEAPMERFRFSQVFLGAFYKGFPAAPIAKVVVLIPIPIGFLGIIEAHSHIAHRINGH